MTYTIEQLSKWLGGPCSVMGSFIPVERVTSVFGWEWEYIWYDLQALGYVYGYHRAVGPSWYGWFDILDPRHTPETIIRPYL